MTHLIRNCLLIAFQIVMFAACAIGQESKEKTTEGHKDSQLDELTRLREEFDRQQKSHEKLYKAFMGIKPLTMNAKDDELLRLQKERFNSAVRELHTTEQIYIGGLTTIELVMKAGKRVVVAGLEIFDTPSDRIELLTNYLALAKLRDNNKQFNLVAGNEDQLSALLSRYERLDVEILLLREKRKQETKP